MLVTSAVLLIAGYLSLRFVPIPPALQRPPVQSIALVDRNGIPLREKRVEERFSRETRLAEVPPHVIAALLAAEDKRFWTHHGIDWLATGRALLNGIRRGHFVSGASTITQQLIKISERRPRTFWTKIIEGIQAVRLEQVWSKDQILAAYVNRLDFGNLNVGLAAAADYYFGKPVGDLSDAEAAFLAGLPKNPRKLNPHAAPEAARARQQTVLRRMQESGALDPARFESARLEPLRVRPARRLFRAAHFVDLVLQQPAVLAPPVIRTTLDLTLNDAVSAVLRERLAQLREQNVHNAAAVVIDNASGDVLALVGSENYFAPGAGQVNGAWAQRSAGSTLKPFTYLLALEAWRNAGQHGGGCAHQFSHDRWLLSSGKLQSPVLRPGAVPDSAGEFAQHLGGESAARRRRPERLARTPPAGGPDEPRSPAGDLRPRPDPGKLRRASARTDECLRLSRPARRVPPVAADARRSDLRAFHFTARNTFGRLRTS